MVPVTGLARSELPQATRKLRFSEENGPKASPEQDIVLVLVTCRMQLREGESARKGREVEGREGVGWGRARNQLSTFLLMYTVQRIARALLQQPVIKEHS